MAFTDIFTRLNPFRRPPATQREEDLARLGVTARAQATPTIKKPTLIAPARPVAKPVAAPTQQTPISQPLAPARPIESPVAPISALQAPGTPIAPQSVASPVSASPDDQEARIRALEKAYIQSLSTPDSEETATQKQLSDLEASRQLGLVSTEEKPIPLEFITGQKEAIERRAAALSVPLSAKLAALQARRQASLEGKKVELEIERERATRLKSEAKEQKASQEESRKFALEHRITKPFYEVGGTVYRTSDGKAFATPEEFFAAGGAQDFSNVEHAKSKDELDQLLTIAEAKSLGVPYGTTKRAALGKTPKGEGAAGTYKFSQEQKTRLLGAGFDNQEIVDIQTDINEFGTDEVLQRLTGKQKQVMQDIFEGVTPTQARKASVPLTESQMTTIVRAYARQLPISEIRSLIQGGQLKINDKDVELSEEQTEKLLAILDQEYPKGKRTFFQKVLPGRR